MVEMTVRSCSEGLRCHEGATWKSGGRDLQEEKKGAA